MKTASSVEVFPKLLSTLAITSFALFVILTSLMVLRFEIGYFSFFQIDISKLFPVHGIQLSHTLVAFWPFLIILFISSLVTLSNFKFSKKAQLEVGRIWGYFLIYMLINHFYIWFIVQPVCVTGCEGGSGGNDGTDDVFYVVYSVIPWNYVLMAGLLTLVRKFLPLLENISREINKLALMILVFAFFIPFLGMFMFVTPLMELFEAVGG